MSAHDELVERVAERFWRKEQIHEGALLPDWYLISEAPKYKEYADLYRSQAREAIRITGEAVAESLRVISDNANNKAVSTTIGAANITIKSLTQGTET